jgi:hypothetical protein
VTLQLKAYGLVEVHPVTMAVLQMYRCTDIRAVSFVAQNDAASTLVD